MKFICFGCRLQLPQKLVALIFHDVIQQQNMKEAKSEGQGSLYQVMCPSIATVVFLGCVSQLCGPLGVWAMTVTERVAFTSSS